MTEIPDRTFRRSEAILTTVCVAVVVVSFGVAIGNGSLGLASFLAGILMTLGLFRNKRPQMAIAVLASIAGLYFVESVLLLRDPGLPPEFDTRHRAQVSLDMRATGTNAYPFFSLNRSLMKSGTPQGLIPLSGMSGVWTIFSNESGRHGKFFSDEFGFNNPAGWSRLAKGEIIAVVGDSFVQGVSVQADETMAARMNARLNDPKTQVVSLGNAGASPLGQLGMIVEYLRRTEPKMVFWCFFEANDLSDLEGDAQTALTNYVEDAGFTQDLWNKQAELNAFWDERMTQKIPLALTRYNSEPESKWRKWSVLGRLRDRIYQRPRADLPPVDGDTLKLFSRVLSRADEEVKSWGGRLIFVYLPSHRRYGQSSPDGNTSAIYNHVLATVRSQNLTLIDLHQEMFVRSEDPMSFFPFRRGGHYNAAGYDRAAEIMFRFVHRTNRTIIQSDSRIP